MSVRQLPPGYTSPICPDCEYDYTDEGGPLAAIDCDCRDKHHRH